MQDVRSNPRELHSLAINSEIYSSQIWPGQRATSAGCDRHSETLPGSKVRKHKLTNKSAYQEAYTEQVFARLTLKL